MTTRRLAVPLAMLCALALTAACGGTTEPKAKPTPSPVPVVDVVATDFAKAKFDRSTVVDNQWFPLVPGTRWVFEGSAKDGDARIPRKVVYIVTNLTKVIGGVRTVVIWERDYEDGELIEAELALFAQDNDGNVWHFGQYPEEYEEGKYVASPAWIAGLAGALPGVTMHKTPRLGALDYAQGFAPPPVDWADRARVHQVGQRTCVVAGCFEGVLVTEEFEIKTPESSQLKFHASGVGLVRVGWLGSKEEEQEVLELVGHTKLSPSEVAQVRKQALRLEVNAYERSKDVYGRTAPAQ